MSERLAGRWIAGLLIAGAWAAAMPAVASVHRHEHRHEYRHEHRHEHGTGHRHERRTEHHAAQRHERRAGGRDRSVPTGRDGAARAHASAPGGATVIPSGGLKVFCPQRSPLMVRKSTQGQGTTVTVICR